MEKIEFKDKSEEVKEKQALWDKTLESLNEIRDGLGLPMDEGIKETVAAFIVNGFPTTSSCEGHVEERFGEKVHNEPHIMIGIPEPAERFIGDTDIKKQIIEKFGITIEDFDRWEHEDANKAYWQYIEEHNPPETPEYQEIKRKNEELFQSISKILETFYENRQATEDAKLVITRIGPAGESYITNAKDHQNPIKDSEVEQHQRRLLIERKEVRDFTELLKERFFGPK